MIFKEFLRYSSLNTVGMLGISFYILADTFFVANGVGAGGLTALNLAIPVYSLVHGIALLLGMGGATMFALEKKGENGNRIFTSTIIFAAAFSLFFMLLGVFFSPQITHFLGANGEVFEMTRIYIQVILLFSPAFILNQIVIAFVRNDGGPALSMAAMVLGSIFNIIFDWIFIFPCQMGIFGAVLATCFSPIFSLLVLAFHKGSLRIEKTIPKARTAKKIVTLGFPSLVTELSTGIVMFVFNLIILNLAGNVGVAGYGVVANIVIVAISLFTGISQGIQPLASKYYSQMQEKIAFRVLFYAIASALLLSVAIYIVIFFFASPIAGIFNRENDQALLEIAIYGLKIYFLGLFPAGVNIILSVFFSSVNRPTPSNILSLLRGIIIIVPMAFLLSTLFEMTGVWLAFGVTEILTLIVGLIILGKNKTKKI